MVKYSNSNRETILMDAVQTKGYFQHSWLRILLIILALVTFIIACAFNGLASTGPNGIYNQRTGNVSNKNPTDFTPAGWTFSIWGLIYFWQAAWLLYALSRIPRKSNENYLYIVPDTLHYIVFVLYIINMGLNIGWLIIWDREQFGWGVLVLFLMCVTIIIPMIITHILLQRNRPAYIRSDRKLDIWLVRVLVHNGLAIYGTWLYIATLLNLTVWISRIYGTTQARIDVSTAALSLVLAGIVVYFVCENLIFYSSMAYTFTPYFVLVFALSGIMSENSKNTSAERNKSFVLALLIISCALFLVRLVLFIVRYVKRQIPTLQDP